MANKKRLTWDDFDEAASQFPAAAADMAREIEANEKTLDYLEELHSFETSLPDVRIAPLVQSFEPFMERIAEIHEVAMSIRITSPDQVEEMKSARRLRIMARNIRVEADKERKALGLEALEYKRAVDGFGNIVIASIKPIEAHLEAQEKYVERMENERLDKIEEERTLEIVAFLPVRTSPSSFNLREMEPAIYDALLDSMKAAAAKREEDRIAKAKADEEEAQRIAKLEEENRKLQSERDRLEREAKNIEENERLEREALRSQLRDERIDLLRTILYPGRTLESLGVDVEHLGDMSKEEFAQESLLLKSKQAQEDQAKSKRELIDRIESYGLETINGVAVSKMKFYSMTLNELVRIEEYARQADLARSIRGDLNIKRLPQCVSWLEELITILTDPDNQPHQYVGKPGILRNEILEMIREGNEIAEYYRGERRV